MKPKRPYRSLQDCKQKYLKDWSYYVRNKRFTKNEFPCLKCHGYGKVHKDEDYDTIEGYKLAPWYTCPQCQGTSKIDIEEFRPRYEYYIKQWRENLAEWQKRQKILKKLTPAEQKFLALKV